MIEQKTIVDQIEVTRAGRVQVRFALLTLRNGVEIAQSWHRTAIEKAGDVDEQIRAVNADITTRPGLMAAPVDAARIGLLKKIVDLVRNGDG